MLCFLAGQVLIAHVNKNQMVIGATAYQTEALSHQTFGKGLGIFHDVGLVFLEFRLQSFAKGHCLGSDDVHQGATLQAGEYGLVNLLGIFLVVGQDNATAGTTQSFMGGGSNKICIRNRRRMQACSY